MKNLAVDIGNVVCHLNLENFVNALSEGVSISKEEAIKFTYTTQKLHDLGLTTIADDIKLKFKPIPNWVLDNIIDEWNKIIHPNQMVIEWLENLLEQGVKIAFLSNMGVEHRELLKYLLGGKLFHLGEKFISCEIGARKPSILFYKTFRDLYPDFEGCLYLDDHPDNVKAGNDFGFRSVLFDLSKLSSEEIQNRLKELENMI